MKNIRKLFIGMALGGALLFGATGCGVWGVALDPGPGPGYLPPYAPSPVISLNPGPPPPVSPPPPSLRPHAFYQPPGGGPGPGGGPAFGNSAPPPGAGPGPGGGRPPL